MKLRIFRISCIALTSLALLVGLALAIFNIFQSEIRQDESYLLYLICFFVGALFLGFEILFISKSFKEGTLLMHGLCLKTNNITKRPITLIIASVIGALCIGYFVVNILAYTNLININQSLMAMEFNMYFCLIIFLNVAQLIVYWIFIVQEDIGVKD